MPTIPNAYKYTNMIWTKILKYDCVAYNKPRIVNAALHQLTCLC